MFPRLPFFFKEYLAWQKRFLNAFSPKMMHTLTVRPHFQDHGWGIVNRLKEHTPALQFESWDIPFSESLQRCRLYVADHLSTTFAEALAANKPIILFWNPEAPINKLHEKAQPYFDLLGKNGILFYNPEEAARAVAEVYNDVEAWWNEPERQKAVRVFCEQFARTSPDALQLWAEEFQRIAALNSQKT